MNGEDANDGPLFEQCRHKAIIVCSKLPFPQNSLIENESKAMRSRQYGCMRKFCLAHALIEYDEDTGKTKV